MLGLLSYLSDDVVPSRAGNREVKTQDSPVFQLNSPSRHEVAVALGSGFAMLRALGGGNQHVSLGLPESPDHLSFPSLHLDDLWEGFLGPCRVPV